MARRHLPAFPAGTAQVDDRHLDRARGQVAGWELRAGASGAWLRADLYVGPGDLPPRLRILTGPAGTPIAGITDPDEADALGDLLAAASARLDDARRPPLPAPEPEPPVVDGQGELFS